jgi:hypothetical protein
VVQLYEVDLHTGDGVNRERSNKTDVTHNCSIPVGAAVVNVYARDSQKCFSASEQSSVTSYVYSNVIILGFNEGIWIKFPTHAVA